MFYCVLKVTPNDQNPKKGDVDIASAHCLLNVPDKKSALIKARFFVGKDNWTICKQQVDIQSVIPNKIDGDILAEKNYAEALETGYYILYVIESNEYEEGTFEQLDVNNDFYFSVFYQSLKKGKNSGRCLHINSGIECDKIIKAHSIQKKQSLEVIAENGKIYQLGHRPNLSNGQAYFEKEGINRVSTFRGFCKKHDNEIFTPIDNSRLTPNKEQAFLYAYRAICRELFVKKNAVNTYKNQLDTPIENQAIKDFMINTHEANRNGYEALLTVKKRYDDILKSGCYNDIEYVAFCSNEKPSVAFSGVYYPDYDFEGRLLQDLMHINVEPKLISYCSAPINNGWAFLFTWVKQDSIVCQQFVKTISNLCHQGQSFDDVLFRLLFSTCENMALSPLWWESLEKLDKDLITKRITASTDPHIAIDPLYLNVGLEGVCNWKLSHVYSEMD